MQEEKEPADSSDENLFDRMSNLDSLPPGKKFQRSKDDVVLTGLCAGIAEYFNVQPANIRLIALLTLLAGGWGAVAYLVAAMLLPADQNPKIKTEEEKISQRRENFRTVLGGLLITTGIHFAFVYIGIRSSGNIFIFPNGLVFSIAALSFGILILTNVFSLPAAHGLLNAIRITRPLKERRILGVCGGLANYLNIDVSSLRIIFILAALLTLGLFIIAYFILGIFTPAETEPNNE